ncbi:MAG: GNAT family N-acetyltransferase [Calditerrivibrio sp.]|nr:GNAT family N-acetyltransferase [Calditerrivibrio sp.]
MYKGDKIILRPFEKRDIEIYRQWVNDGEIASLVDRVLPVTEIEHERWYDSIQQNQNIVVFAIEEKTTNKYIGNVWLYNVDYRHRKAEVRILIGDSEGKNKGFGTEALKMISLFAFNKMNLHKLYAYVLASNIRAKKSFEKAGFVEEGILKKDRFVNGHYEDVFLMAKISDI